jgi:hypothetical protein
MKTIFAALAIMATLISQAAAAAPDHSANYYLPSCRAFVNKQFASDPFTQGECVGILEALAMTATDLDPAAFVISRSCAPDDATLPQVTAVVVRWLDERPQRWNEDFRALALLALHDAWPCK